MRPAPDHRVHEERGGEDLQGGDDAIRALAARHHVGRLHRPTRRCVVHSARWVGRVVVSLRAATGAAATPRSGCSSAWAAASARL